MNKASSIRYAEVVSLLSIFLVLLGCSKQVVFAPVEDKIQPPNTKVREHVVAPGETLYAIAWRYDLDYQSLAKANKIGGSYRIQPGQKLRLDLSHVLLDEAEGRRSLDSTSKAKTNTKVAKADSSYRAENKTKLNNKRTVQNFPAQISTWVWPAKGGVLARFSAKGGLNKGIDIAGNLGESVHAAAAGSVVFSGEGLRGYGKLIIVKHNGNYLSAYAHNHTLLVSEGDQVKVGQRIAKMGASGTDRVKLHFEIRYDGKPVDPLQYLPKR